MGELGTVCYRGACAFCWVTWPGRVEHEAVVEGCPCARGPCASTQPSCRGQDCPGLLRSTPGSRHGAAGAVLMLEGMHRTEV